MDVCVRMVQTSKYCWQILSPSGKVIVDSIFLNDASQARDYVKAYVSSFTGWGYEVKGMDAEA